MIVKRIEQDGEERRGEWLASLDCTGFEVRCFCSIREPQKSGTEPVTERSETPLIDCLSRSALRMIVCVCNLRTLSKAVHSVGCTTKVVSSTLSDTKL